MMTMTILVILLVTNEPSELLEFLILLMRNLCRPSTSTTPTSSLARSASSELSLS